MTSFLTLIFVLSLTSCAQKQVAPPEPLVSQNDEKFAAMAERLETQDKEIERLKLALSDLQMKSVPAPVAVPTPTHAKKLKKGATLKSVSRISKLPVQKLTPNDAGYTTALSKDPIAKGLGLEDVTIADSAQESLHLYYAALDLMDSKKFEDAVKKLDQFVKLNPKHVYADRAQYLMAEAAYQTKEHHLAIVATNVLESRFPYSVRIPDALLLRGRALVAMDLKDKAKEAYEKLVKNFPGAVQAELGAKELAVLSLAGAKAPVTLSPEVTKSDTTVSAPPLMPDPSAEETESQN